MPGPAERDDSARARLALVEPSAMTVTWMNEAAAASLLGGEGSFAPGMPLERIVPMTGTRDVIEALSEVAATGEPRHVTVDLVSTGRGSVTVNTSVYRLPDGMLLVLTENTWQTKSAEERTPRRSPRRGR